jgi:type I restriction enzyme S subunit
MGITANIDISAEQRQILLDLLSKYLANTKVWAFGSRVKWTTRSNSDLDLVVFSSPEQDSQVSALKEALEESNLPFRVDLLVWDKLPESFKRNIEEGYVVLVEGDDLDRDVIMRSNWRRLPVTEVCTLIVDCVNKTAPNVDYVTPYKMIRTPNIKGGRVNVADCRYVEKDVFDKWTRRASVENDDVLLTREAPMGEVGIVNTKENIFLGQRIVQYRANKKVMNPRFLLYSFLSNDLQNQFRAHEGSGSVVSHIRVPDCLKFEINVPPLKIQNWIVNVLGSIDDKIELNRQTNQTLEQIALALFKSWFVDFEPVKAKIAAKQAGANAEQIEQAAICAISGKTPEQLAQLNPQILQQLKTTAALFPDALVDSELGEIPEGWDITVLGELLEFNPKRTLKSGTLAPYLDMKNVPIQGHLVDEVCLREMASGTKFINGDTLLARITPCLENGKTAYVDFLEKDQIGWGSTEFIVLRPRNGRPTSLGYIIARLDTFRAKAIQTMTGTSGRQRASAQAIAEQLWINYPIELLNIYDLVAGCHLKKAKSNGDENNILSKLRDSLLPKLLSGELDLSNLDEPTVFNRDVGTGRDLSLRLNSPNVE